MASVSVVIPAYDAQRFIGAAIESVLSQSKPPDEIVVVDDGSRDDTRAIANRFAPRVACITQRNSGVAAARNRGVVATATEWIAFLDADDLWRPHKLERQLHAAQTSQADVVLCDLGLIDLEGRQLPQQPRATSLDIEPLLLHRDEIPQGTSSTILVRRALFDEIGRYDEGLATMADWDLLIRLRLRTTFAHVAEPLALYRRYSGTMSRSVALLERESRIILEKTFSRGDLAPELRRLRTACLAWNDLVLSGSHLHAGNLTRAVQYGLRAVLRDPRLTPRLLGFPLRAASRRLMREPSTHDP
jgi:glycosyltransferase involved in cell wall biosynthesis